MLECSGAASAVNADVLCCKDDISEGISSSLLAYFPATSLHRDMKQKALSRPCAHI